MWFFVDRCCCRLVGLVGFEIKLRYRFIVIRFWFQLSEDKSGWGKERKRESHEVINQAGAWSRFASRLEALELERKCDLWGIEASYVVRQLLCWSARFSCEKSSIIFSLVLMHQGKAEEDARKNKNRILWYPRKMQLFFLVVMPLSVMKDNGWDIWY